MHSFPHLTKIIQFKRSLPHGTYLKIYSYTKEKAQKYKCLPGKHKGLSLIPSTKKTNPNQTKPKELKNLFFLCNCQRQAFLCLYY